jgi:hypothetical protein
VPASRAPAVARIYPPFFGNFCAGKSTTPPGSASAWQKLFRAKLPLARDGECLTIAVEPEAEAGINCLAEIEKIQQPIRMHEHKTCQPAFTAKQ